MTDTKKKINAKTLMLTELAALTAIMFVMHITSIAYITVFAMPMTLMMVPVIVGATTLGKSAGAYLGLIFGITSMMHPLSAVFLGINAPGTILLNVGVRILVGFLTACIYQLIKKFDKTKTWSYALAGFSGSILNTVFYMTVLVLVFGKNAEAMGIIQMDALFGLPSFNIIYLAIAAVAIQAAIEAVICTILGGTLAKVVDKYVRT